jgi:DNA replication and repair protein RecF
MQRSTEVRRGITLVGPHRDELHLQLGGRDLRTFGSAGQQRSAAIALRLLELATLRGALGYSPLLLLDDPFAELDLGRAGRVLDLLEDAGASQVLLAVPREEDIPLAFTRLDRRTMRDGALS